VTTVWISPSATAFSCVCETCMEDARQAGKLFSDALMVWSVRGSIAADADLAVARCASGHKLTLRRVERPPALLRPDERQLQLK
jgi:hypothetical protein